jgi:hypothetical protein
MPMWDWLSRRRERRRELEEGVDADLVADNRRPDSHPGLT